MQVSAFGEAVHVGALEVLLAPVREAVSPLPSLAEWAKQDDAHSGGSVGVSGYVVLLAPIREAVSPSSA